MGIKGLMQLLQDSAPDSYKETTQKTYFGKVIAIDASMQLYQFLVQIRVAGAGNLGQAQLLTNSSGEITSHLMGFLNRTTTLLENGIKPVYVFDGKPPSLKGGELEKRREIKSKALSELKEAETRAEVADIEESDLKQAVADIDKAAKRTVKVTKLQNEEVKRLIQLMGLPIVEAPGEAEAQCAELVKSGKAFAMGTEDMDALTFGTPILLRKLTDTKSKTVVEIDVQKVLEELELDYDQFIDLCILCGCDYSDTIKGVGPKTALKLIRKHGDIETILDYTDSKKIPELFEENLEAVRELFKNPLIKSSEKIDLKFSEPDKNGLIEFLVKEKGFSQDRVNKILQRISKKPSNQITLDSFVKKGPTKKN